MDFIAQFGAVSETQTRFWARQISLAIQYLHTLGIGGSLAIGELNYKKKKLFNNFRYCS